MQKKVILINLPPSPVYSYNNVGAVYPATGILIVGTILMKNGIKVQIIDGAVRNDYIQIALEAIDSDTGFIGFSVMTSQVPMALSLSKLIKAKRQDIPVVWGGIHPVLFPEQTVADRNIDVVVTGEGFETVLGLIDFINKKIDIKDIKGIGYKDASGKVFLTEYSPIDDMNNLPHIDYSILDDAETYLNVKSAYQREIETEHNEKLRVVPVLSGLGCCYKCQFCINVILKRKYRFKSAESIIDEIKNLQNKYRANTFVFYDEDFLISKKRLMDFLDLIEKNNLKFYWRIWARVNYFREDYLNKDLISRMESLGLRSIVMGAESGSQKILDFIKKGIRIEHILYSAKMLNGTKITPRYSFIVGLDSEEKEDTAKTYKLCAELINTNPKVDIAGPFIFRYYPGSPIFDNIVKNYKLEMPQMLEDWERSISDEGFLKIDDMPWLWDGFIETVTILNKEMLIYWKLRNTNNFIGNSIKKIVKWRIENLNTRYPVEVYIYDLLKSIYLKIKS